LSNAISNSAISNLAVTAYSGTSATGARMGEGAKNLANAPGHIMEGYRNGGSGNNNYQEEKLNGKTKS